MKKLLIGSVVAMLCSGSLVAYADDAHQHGSAAPGSAAGKLPGQSVAADKSMGSAEASGVNEAQMARAQERMKQAQDLMARLREAKNPAERQKLMREHRQAMHDTMGMMRGMETGMGMMGGCQGMGMMGGGQGMGMMMDMHHMMEVRMEMMQMMMEQMLEQQEMLTRDK